MSLLTMPSFLLGVSLMYWCFELGALTLFIQFWNFGQRSDFEGVLTFLKWAFRYKVVKVGDEQLYTEKRCIYLCNHRCWADFFVDSYILGGRSVPMSRMAVGLAFPAFTSSLMAIKGILLFNRAGVRDTDKFNAWVDRASASAHAPSLLVYPEGTRSLRQASLPLKRGMLRYAHSRRLPVQVAITAHKEEILNERRRRAHWGSTVVTGFSEVVDSTQYEDFEVFMQKVQQLWDAQWERVHAAPREGLPTHRPSFPPKQYSPSELALQTLSLSFWGALLTAMLYYWVRALAAVAAWGLLGRCLLGTLALYVAASMAVACLPPSKKRPARKQE